MLVETASFSPESSRALLWKLRGVRTGLLLLLAAGFLAPPVAAQGPRVSLSGNGLSIDGAQGRDSWRLGLPLASWGRGDARELVRAGAPTVEGSRRSTARGPITEWLVHDVHGIEHGFTILSPPAAPEDGGPLCLAMSVVGDFAAAVSGDGHDVVFTGRSGQPRIHYSGLGAWDATGCGLEARFSLVDGQLVIRVQDEGAAYPLTIDPWVWAETAKLVASDAAADDRFGTSAALSGTTALLGARGQDGNALNSGAVYVFVKDPMGWNEEARLVPPGGTLHEDFGRSVSLEGNTALVGAPGYGDHRVGAAFVFVRSSSGWTQEAMLLGDEFTEYCQLGYSVSLSGDTALVGAYGDHDAGFSSGAAYAFLRTGTTWTRQAKLVPDDTEAGDWFGVSVAVEGDTAVIGATGRNRWTGAVFVFTRTAAGWQQQAKLEASNAAISASFGSAVDILGDRILVGAWRYVLHAYVFRRTDAGWEEEAILTADDAQDSVDYGCAVALSRDLAIVGARRHRGAAVGGGAVYAFRATGAGWTREALLWGIDTSFADSFGQAVAFDGDSLLVGAPGDNSVGVGASTGSAYVFTRTPMAAAAFRTAGANSASYDAATLPILGTTYTGTVDLGGTTGHALARLVGYASPASFDVGAGQVLLTNIADPAGELLGQALAAGPVARFLVPVPFDLSLAGLEVATQALHFGGGASFALSNARDLFLGF